VIATNRENTGESGKPVAGKAMTQAEATIEDSKSGKNDKDYTPIPGNKIDTEETGISVENQIQADPRYKEMHQMQPEFTTETISGTTENASDELARLEAIIPTLMLRDSSLKELHLPDQLSDTGMTAEEAAAMLLAGYYGEDEKEKARKHNWTLGSEIAPLFSDRSVNMDKSESAGITNFNETESGVLAYAGGFRIALNTGKRLSVQSGIYYSRYGQEKNNVSAVTTSFQEPDAQNYRFITVSNSTGTITGVLDAQAQSDRQPDKQIIETITEVNYDGINNYSYKPLVQGNAENVVLRQYFDYFEVPLILKYKIIDRKLDFSFSGGLVTNFLVGNEVDMINDGETTIIGETTDISQVNYLGSVGMGLEYPVVRNFSFTLEPRFRYYINPIDRSSSHSVHPFSFGFFAGINYRF